jgi:formylglycine-generating enzyme required for sulfatase activity
MGSGYEDWLDDGAPVTTTVGSYRANPFGLHDVHGNVYEWCREVKISYLSQHRQGDGELVYSESTPLLLTGRDSRVFRGGGWDYMSGAASSAHRPSMRPGFTCQDLGLRPARPIL